MADLMGKMYVRVRKIIYQNLMGGKNRKYPNFFLLTFMILEYEMRFSQNYTFWTRRKHNLNKSSPIDYNFNCIASKLHSSQKPVWFSCDVQFFSYKQCFDDFFLQKFYFFPPNVQNLAIIIYKKKNHTYFWSCWYADLEQYWFSFPGQKLREFSSCTLKTCRQTFDLFHYFAGKIQNKAIFSCSTRT